MAELLDGSTLSKASGDLVTSNLQPVQRGSKQHCISAERKTVSKLDICCKVPHQRADNAQATVPQFL